MMMRTSIKLLALRAISIPVAALALTACSPRGQADNQVIIDNAVDADTTVTADADDRADRLDELAGELTQQANKTGGATAGSLKNEAADDVAAATAIRQRGQIDGARTEDNIEAAGGLFNQR